MNRQEFDRQTKLAIRARATDANDILRCEQCHCAIKGRNFQVDHILADGLRTAEDKKRKLVAADGQLLCSGTQESCHSIKTHTKDVPAIAKMKRQESKDAGVTSSNERPGSRSLKAPPKDRTYKDPFAGLPRRNPLTGEIFK
jgi:hypothetical protein